MSDGAFSGWRGAPAGVRVGENNNGRQPSDVAHVHRGTPGAHAATEYP